MADVVPEVGALGFAERDEPRGLRGGRNTELCEFTGGALTNFGDAFDTHTKMPAIGRDFFLKGRGGRFRRTLFGFDENLHELRTDKIDGGSANRRAFYEIAEGETVFVRAKREDEAAAGRRCRERAEVEASNHGESAERADEQLVKIIPGDIFDHASTALAEAAGAIDKFRANQEVTRGAVCMAK